MTHTVTWNLAAGLLLVGGLLGCHAAGVASDDLQETEGTWTLVSGEMNGQPFTEEEIRNCKLTITGDRYVVELGEMGVKTGIQKLDASQSPKHIDALDSAGPTTGENLGIYEFLPNGDFRVCFAPTGKERPTQFVTTPEDGNFIHVWRRAE